ncbi:hypothetical protein ACGFMK_26120 [Amycolatopsis sp. NPDC049252]|uniref:hypothetical protein n=1 Tax=Amycolatopsis sp. NPDC049252 TaxID=3363933 RepID=UPI003712D813
MEYIEVSKRVFDHTPSTHRLGLPVIDVNGTRAIAEVPVTIEIRGTFRGVETDLTAHLRMLHRVERAADGWRPVAIFDHDTMTSAIPGVTRTASSSHVAPDGRAGAGRGGRVRPPAPVPSSSRTHPASTVHARTLARSSAGPRYRGRAGRSLIEFRHTMTITERPARFPASRATHRADNLCSSMARIERQPTKSACASRRIAP